MCEVDRVLHFRSGPNLSKPFTFLIAPEGPDSLSLSPPILNPLPTSPVQTGKGVPQSSA